MHTRMTAQMGDKPFVVFLIGMRINRFWRIDRWLPVGRAMGQMLKELKANPADGLLGVENAGFSSPSVMIQYWESVEKLHAYARAKDRSHHPAWVKFMKRTRGNNAVGVWHESYVVEPGNYEAVYVNFPRPFGLGNVGDLVPINGRLTTAAGRMASAG